MKEQNKRKEIWSNLIRGSMSIKNQISGGIMAVISMFIWLFASVFESDLARAIKFSLLKLNKKFFVMIAVLLVAGAVLVIAGNVIVKDGIMEITGTGDSYFTGNVGIGTPSPGEKLTVAGTIESTTGGIKFPDGTVQTTAAGVQKYESEWFWVADDNTVTKAHGLGDIPTIVQLWFSNTNDGSGWVVVSGTYEADSGYGIGVVDIDAVDIKVRCHDYCVDFYDATGTRRNPGSGWAKVVALRFQ